MVNLCCVIVGEAEEVFEVDIDADASVTKLKEAIKEVNDDVKFSSHKLKLFLAKKNSAWLKNDDSLDAVLLSGDVTPYKKMRGSWKLNDSELFGSGILPTKKVVHVLVVIPPQAPPQGLALAPAVQIPECTPLKNGKQYLAECSLDEWKAGKVRKIPLIWQIMESCGGCTAKKKIFWREEEKQVASILLRRWFRESSGSSSYDKCVLVGSPGIGKSTLLVVMAFFLVLKHKKNVLVYRRSTKVNQGYCLLYLGYQEELDKRSNVWLLLDGLEYESIPPGLITFRMLATSQQAELKPSEREEAYHCLLPCWKKQDLFKLGREVYDFEEKNMEDRFYISGGSVRIFAKETANFLKDMRIIVSTVCTQVKNLLALYPRNVDSGSYHVDMLRRTYIKNIQDSENYLFRSHWEGVIDSEYAVLLLSQQLRSGELLRCLRWAQGAGHDALAGTVFEICFHRLAVDNDLTLYVSEYDPLKRSKVRQVVDKVQLDLKEGEAFCSETATWYGFDEKELKKWRDEDSLSYWYPYCDDFPNIDGIVKLKPSSSNKKRRVAFIHLAVGQQHTVDEKQLKPLIKIFTAKGFESPIYIVVCPDLDSCNKIVVKGAGGACQVFVGYYDKSPLEYRSDGWRYSATHKEEKPSETYELPPSRARQIQ